MVLPTVTAKVSVETYELSRVQDNLTGPLDMLLTVLRGSPGNSMITWGRGVPTQTGAKGSLYIRTDGGAGSTLYLNETGTAAWRAI